MVCECLQSRILAVVCVEVRGQLTSSGLHRKQLALKEANCMPCGLKINDGDYCLVLSILQHLFTR